MTFLWSIFFTKSDRAPSTIFFILMYYNPYIGVSTSTRWRYNQPPIRQISIDFCLQRVLKRWTFLALYFKKKVQTLLGFRTNFQIEI